ncbi:DUF6090 family protein [Mangrovimonas sp. DI 80]|uniref:DUF6090 family protein n=1 Tax=Mangrovimonas sp. DI 80 TaxID=1779330 RepID=UPI000975B368|nr:DUF6090 family protein [Mangrovimonas sp. DI 80]OMP32019.1 hypothetical protein BKM32_02890 [Mangrovimonas sp. DI 80]
MINFFRKIRQQLLSDGKTGKYFKYATGEIILVVIGILIAVKVNGWVNTSKLKKANRVYLEKMINELELNKKRMSMLSNHELTEESLYIGLEQAIKNCDSLLKKTYSGLEEDDILFYINNPISAGGSYLNLYRSVYDELLNTGKLYTIGSESIETAIKNYYLRCEREDLYNKANTESIKEGFRLMENSLTKLIQDYVRDNQNFNISNYPWYFDKKSNEYQNLQIALGKILRGQKTNLIKIQQIHQFSDSLIVNINKEL